MNGMALKDELGGIAKLQKDDAERFFSASASATVDGGFVASSSSASGNSSFPSMMKEESDPFALFEVLVMKEADLYELASQPPTPLKLSDMYKYAVVADKEQRLRNAQYLHRELPIRVAQRAVDLLTLPHGLSEAIPIRQVACAYIQKMHSMLSMPMPKTFAQEEQFTDLLKTLVLDRSSIPMAIARGLAVWSDDRRELEVERMQEMEDALYRFFTARVGLRLLTEHHVLSCHRESAKSLRKVTCMFPDEEDDYSGCIHSSIDLVREVTRVADLVVEQTKEFYGFSPEIEVVDCIDKMNTGDFTYVRDHLHYMIGELLKNSCTATVRQFKGRETTVPNEEKALGTLGAAAAAASTPSLPAIRVVVVKGDEDVTIKVADKGGGIPRSRMARIWKFAHSTADSPCPFGNDNLSGAKIRGFGLPLCRIYARYLGGDLTLKSMEGHGLDAYLHLPRLGVACEKLPRLVRHSPGDRDSTPNQNVRNFSTAATPQATPATAELLMEDLRDCLTAEVRNRRILDFLYSRAL